MGYARPIVLMAVAMLIGAACNSRPNAAPTTPSTSTSVPASTSVEKAATSTSRPTVDSSVSVATPSPSTTIELPDTDACGEDLDAAAGFNDGVVRIGVRSFYEDWTQANEVFSALITEPLSSDGRAINAEVQVELVEVGVGEPIPDDLGLLVDYVPAGILAEESVLPKCLPVLAANYWQGVVDPWTVPMPVLTGVAEARLWAAHLNKTLAGGSTVGVLAVDLPLGDTLLAALADHLDSGLDLVTIRHGIRSNEVENEILEILDADPEALVVITPVSPAVALLSPSKISGPHHWRSNSSRRSASGSIPPTSRRSSKVGWPSGSRNPTTPISMNIFESRLTHQVGSRISPTWRIRPRPRHGGFSTRSPRGRLIGSGSSKRCSRRRLVPHG